MRTSRIVVCDRGHKFYRSSDYPVCPQCWAGFYKTKFQNDFPEGMSAPALRALAQAKIRKLADLKKWTRKELLGLHGFGQRALVLLGRAMQRKKYKFKPEPRTSR